MHKSPEVGRVVSCNGSLDCQRLHHNSLAPRIKRLQQCRGNSSQVAQHLPQSSTSASKCANTPGVMTHIYGFYDYRVSLAVILESWQLHTANPYT